MAETPTSANPSLARAIGQVACGALLLGLALYILFPFLTGLAWSIIIVIAMWPILKRLQRALPGYSQGAIAGLMTLLVALFLVVAVLPLSARLSKEVKRVTGSVGEVAELEVEDLARKVEDIPYLGSYVSSAFKDTQGSVRDALVPLIGDNKASFVGFLSRAAQGIAHFIFNIITILFCCYFLFRGGDEFASEIKILTRNLGGPRARELLNVAWSTIIAVVYGVLCTAFAQGILAGFGFAVAGVPSPVLLGIATMVLSFVPFGAPLIYIPVSGYLLMTETSPVWGIAVLVWGVCVVSLADNVLRPLFICSSTNLSLFLSLLGVIGGLIAFGLIGVFLGPMILAVVSSLWNWWVEESRAVVAARETVPL